MNPTGLSVLIIAGEFAGAEGVCLGPASGTPGLWAVSPHMSDRIVYLEYDREFGALVNPGRPDPEQN
jgi:hypothetical protein